MIMKINNFVDYVVDSGFFRDVQEFIKTIAQPQNAQNIVLLTDISKKVLEQLETIQESDVPNDLLFLLPEEKIKRFNPEDHLKALSDLIDDSEIDTSQYHAQLTQLLSQLESQLKTNQQEVMKLHAILLPFYKKDLEVSEKAVISFIFKDINTISNLKKFAKVLNRWNRTLHIYHQLVTSKGPKDIELVNIQNGSLDVVLNMDLNVALDLTEIVKYGFLAFNGYLLYKMRVHEIIEAYFGDKKLIDSEKERDKGLLENIGNTIKRKLLEQHKLRKKTDKNINKESINKKIDDIASVLSEHIIKGNDIKLLIDFDAGEEKDEEVDEARKLIGDAKEASLKVRNNLSKLSTDEKQLLLEKYTITDDNNDT